MPRDEQGPISLYSLLIDDLLIELEEGDMSIQYSLVLLPTLIHH